MYKACIFDLDGTLTDTLESLTYSVNVTLQEMGLGSISQEQCRTFIGNGARRLMEKSLHVAGDVLAERIDEAMTIYGRVLDKYCTYQVAPYQGIVELLAALKREGIQLAVLSNKPHPQTVDVVQSFFGTETFSKVYGQRDDVPRKPDPSAVYGILEELQIMQEECIYIGDSEVDMKTGCAAGVKTVGVTWGFRDRQVLIDHGANFIIDQPEELMLIVKGEK